MLEALLQDWPPTASTDTAPTTGAAADTAPVSGTVGKRKQRKLELQSVRRADAFAVKQTVRASGVDVQHADTLISTLLSSPAGKKLVPLSSTVLDTAVLGVKEEASQAIKHLTAGMPARSRNMKTIVVRLYERAGRNFTV